jgi:hypothetical protein
MNKYTTKTTRSEKGYYCRVLCNGRPVVEGEALSKSEIGPVYRDLLRTLDKLGGDSFTSAARKRKFKEGNETISIKHIWRKE